MNLDAHSFHLFNMSLEQNTLKQKVIGTASNETVVHTFQVGGT